MEAVIRNGAVVLPKRIMKLAHLPKKGKCEVTVDNEEVKIIKKTYKTNISHYKILEDLKKPPKRMSINEMAMNEIVDED